MSTRPVPRTVSATFHLTHACNLRCTYCYTGEKSADAITPATADRAVDFALAEADLQGAEHLEVVFFGGEPLVRFDLMCRVIDRTVARAATRRVSFKMSTNGTLLSAGVLRELARREVYVSLSLDGDPETQDAQRPFAGGGGSSSRLAEVIPRLLEINPCANVTCVFTPASSPRLDTAVGWLLDRGFAYVTPSLDYAAPWTRTDLLALRDAYRRLGEDYVQRTLSGQKFYISGFDERIRTWTHGPLDASERCAAGSRQFSIAPSGRLYPCVQFVGEDRDPEWVLGDVFRGWDDARREEMGRCSERPKPECSGCSLDRRCSSWCACVNWRSTGHADRASPVLCEVERLLMPVVDEVANRLWRRRHPTFLHKQYNPAYPVLSLAESLVLRRSEAFHV